ncbi:MAG: biotin--[acetyl-CoA-carboxylase] ligase [Tepidamorphaceae bacterium]
MTAADAAVHAAAVIRLDSVDSTNAEARRHIAGGANAVWVVAGRQTQGRGRRARAWVSEPGNLYTSLRFRPDCPPGRLGEYAFVSALALHDAIGCVCPAAGTHIALKWPNDLIAPEGKLSGILLESESGTAGSPPLLIIGWGVNCRHHPDGGSYPAADLASLGFDVPPERLFEALRDTFLHYDQMLRNHGMAMIRHAWLARARGVGKPVTVRLENQTLEGIFRDLDADGRLILELPDGERMKISTGDIFFPNIAGEENHV